MTKENHSTPDELLKAVQSYENKQGKGHLKIFLGMAPGVGKTYAMLETAQKKQKEGVNVIVGWVETHHRSDTAKLLEGLPIVQKKSLFYRDREFEEFDLDRALELKPQLIIVDELAHSNVPGSRHEKRWQDVLELLDANIDVYTTLNVQHVENFKDIIQEIVKIRISETIPNLILEQASDIELVDLTPQELLERLKEGKVYTGDMPAIAIENFFQEDRLTALRELSLLLTADIVDKELREMFATLQKRKGWKSKEKLLVAIDPELNAQQLIRIASRQAFRLHAPWIALYVDTTVPLDLQENEILTKNLALARELGAEVITTKDPHLAEGIQRVAEQKEVSEILIGKESRPFRNIFKPSLLDQLIKKCASTSIKISVQPLSFNLPKKKSKQEKVTHSLLSYLYVILWVGILSLICGYTASQIGYKIADFLFLLTIFSSALIFERGPLLFATTLCILIWYAFFVPPPGTLYIGSAEDISVFFLFFTVSLIMGIQIRRTRNREQLLLKRELSTRAIYDIVKEISSAPSMDQVLEGFNKKVGSILNGTCKITLGHDQLIFDKEFNNKEKAIATWVFKNGKEAGWSTSTLASAQNLYIPLKGFKDIVGVISYQPNHNTPLPVEEVNFFYTVAKQLANYIERSFAETQEKEHLFLGKTEKIYNRILRAISTELETPLKGIEKALLALEQEPKIELTPLIASEVAEIEHATERIKRIRDNAAAMEKLSTGFIKFQKTPQDIHPLIHTCHNKMKKQLKEHHLIIRISDTLPPLSFDFSLMEILLTNLLLNAIEYSPIGTTIELEAECMDKSFILSIADEGPGIPEGIIDKIFEKFYKAPGDTTAGLGLGLAIVSSIATIHQGEIRVQNRPTGGAKFFLILPL